MSKIKKFGTFAGVYTPSVLTILGVIMYMRLGWVVGEAGLISAIVIIVIAHLISITTGLSISSVATDKKIKTGGIYYMLSRSLGFPMGGAIGIALFIGTALSISLYLVGFAESFLAVESIQKFLHITPGINGNRIIGSIFLLLLVIIAFISTSLAIKTQFYILGAIALSIISIGIGFFTNSQLAPIEPLMAASENEISLSVIFAIFFPAVTGFTAGVAMSGDLKDPKKSIPGGTLAAIATGFIVYIGLAVALAFFVNRDLLINDYNFFLKVAFFSPLVLAGIWGATLSSALGGILGGPRILQAMSVDSVTPKIFAKGVGASNEPRNALIFIFIIAEIGILIGELNVIAGVVSMFYLASYGFINIAYFLESWASTDFRPSFKINRYIGLVGAIACFGVMFQLDMIAMFASLIIMLAIYLYLSRKQLQNDSGDVWQSVGMSIVREVLHRMDKKTIEQRNWQPNIILFSGGTSRRPHLIEFGKALVGKYGMLSNFDLHETKEKKYLFPKHLQSVPSDEIAGAGVFTRRQTCSDIYKGIETISSTYGFSGIVPNTVLMGWARQSASHKRFAQMIQRIHDLDMNMVLIDYDQRYGYGKYKQIDIWWRGAGNHGNLALTLMKFLWSSEDWLDANLRLLIVNPINEEGAKIKQQAENAIDSLRISAEVRIINNQIEKKSFYDLIRIESVNSDLIILGIPEIEKGKESEFVETTGQLMHDIGTVVLIKASSQFKALNFGTKTQRVSSGEFDNLNAIIQSTEITQVKLPANAAAAENLEQLQTQLFTINTEFIENCLQKIADGNQSLNQKIVDTINTTVAQILKNIEPEAEPIGQARQLSDALSKALTKAEDLIDQYNEEVLDLQTSFILNSIDNYIAQTDKILLNIPDYQLITYSLDDLKINDNDDKKTLKYKAKNTAQLKRTGKKTKYKLAYRKLLQTYLPLQNYHILKDTIEKIGVANTVHTFAIQKLSNDFLHQTIDLQSQAELKKLTKSQLTAFKKQVKETTNRFLQETSSNASSTALFLQNETAKLLNKIGNDILKININKLLKRTKTIKIEQKELLIKIGEIPEMWHNNAKMLYRASVTEIKLSEIAGRLNAIFKSSAKAMNTTTEQEISNKLVSSTNYLRTFINDFETNPGTLYLPPTFDETPQKEILYLRFKEVLDISFELLKKIPSELPEKIELLSNASFNEFSQKQFDEPKTVTIFIEKLLDFLVQDELISPVLKIIDSFPDKLIKQSIEGQNIMRLIAFSFFNSAGEIINPEENSTEKIINFIKTQTVKLDEVIVAVNQTKEHTQRQINERFNSVSAKMTVHSIVVLAENFKQYRSKIDKNRRSSFLTDKITSVKDFTNGQVNKLWYRHSEAILLKKQIENSENQNNTKVNDILSLYEQVSLKDDVLEEMPFYYQQLFLRKHNYSNEFWFGRKKELYAAKKAFDRRKQGFSGALMITGESNSGKTFLANYIASKFAPESRLFTIQPHFSGSTEPVLFKAKLSEALAQKGTFKTIFAQLPAGSIILIEDLELWFEKSKNGLQVITKIIELIELYGNTHFFIITANTESFKLINRLLPIENYFLNIINCSPFNAEELKNIIMFRHNSSGLKLKLKNKVQDKFRPRDYAKLFARHFAYSQGNPGVSILAWTSNIKKIGNEIVEIRSPKVPDISPLDNLQTETLILLTQFVLHRRMNLKKMERVTFHKKELLEQQINYLKRTGILIEEAEGIYEINKFMNLHIVKKLKNIEML